MTTTPLERHRLERHRPTLPSSPSPASLATLLVVALALVPAGCGDEELEPFVAGPCDLDCDDGNPCTHDFCIDAACEYEPVDEGAPCGAAGGGDGDLCQASATCDGAGVCVETEAAVVDDGDGCTEDTCDPTTGDVTHDRAPGCVDWVATSEVEAPRARWRHSAVWTGQEMIVWGGLVVEDPGVTNTGARYDPETDEWHPVSSVGAPTARQGHAAVWTGSRMLVWGGFGETDYEVSGGSYDPATDTWSAITTAGAPTGRTDHSAVWTGSHLVVWGGNNSGPLGNGGAYDPAQDAWEATSFDGSPSPRFRHSAVWADDRMVVWGGNDLSDWQLTGAVMDGALAWTGATSTDGAPSPREQHVAVWSGDAMLVWGGFTGGVYDPQGGVLDLATAGGTWSAMTLTGAPAGRVDHVGVWTGSQLFVWGGCGTDSCASVYGDGGLWTPGGSGGVWSAVDARAPLSARRLATAVWTGTEVVVWGGRDASGTLLQSGARAPL